VTCCDTIQQPFTNVATVSVPYGAFEKQQYGSTPNVQVYIFDGVDYVLSDDQNQIIIEAGTIEIDLGGIATGFVKVF
jgi:hypothetical protein